VPGTDDTARPLLLFKHQIQAHEEFEVVRRVPDQVVAENLKFESKDEKRFFREKRGAVEASKEGQDQGCHRTL
jgi:hypothetical protein